MTSFVRPLTMVFASAPVWLTTFSPATADDWPQWGGPKRTWSGEKRASSRLCPPRASPRVWSTPWRGLLGTGPLPMGVSNHRLHPQQADRTGPFADAETGKFLWTHPYPVRYSISYPAGPRMTPVIERDRVYTIGSMGDMFCLKVSDGSVIWKKNFGAD
ncbi:MAG: hypothetical protein CM1200mP2_51280 [Planctomycetaceae bacterium]|nr:MAG: hypothetical protein CM1200mP2_51280 [Planctomycetaceae bacterium]